MKKIRLSILLPVIILLRATAPAQVNVQDQLNTIPANFTAYTEAYLTNLTGHQGFASLNNLNTTGRVNAQWELTFSLKAGVGLSTDIVPVDFSANFEPDGRMPAVFGSEVPGKLVFRFLDEETGVPVVNPFTGKNLGFGLPMFSGIGTNIGFSPSLMPVFTLGLGFGTEISAGVLPGIIKLSTKGMADSFTVNKDVMAAFGIRHDVFNWFPALHDRKFYFSLGVNYSLLNLGITAGPELIGDIDEPSSDIVSVTDNLAGLSFGSSNLGVEAVLTKKFGFLDVSLFSSWNQSAYKMSSEGGLDVKVAKSFYSTIDEAFDSYSITNLLEVNRTVSTFIYGLALQFNMGRFNIALKASPTGGHYYSFGLGYKILQKKPT
jgi:hypothetical protein